MIKAKEQMFFSLKESVFNIYLLVISCLGSWFVFKTKISMDNSLFLYNFIILNFEQIMASVISSIISAFFITYIAIPSIIRVAEIKHLHDEPGERSSHNSKTPTLGGLAIFAGLTLSFTFWTAPFVSSCNQYILSAIIILFFVGIKDDIFPLTPFKKFAGQIIAALIIVLAADIRVSNMQGIFGFYEIPYLASILLSIFAILAIINAYNLIDGIDGLSAGLGLISCIVFGAIYFLMNNYVLAILAFSLAGALIAFLKYNFSPAQIFMGDTGSLVVGVVLSILAIQLLEYDKLYLKYIGEINTMPTVVFSVLIIPLFDTLRVFCIRLFIKKCSPFTPDKNHIHHVMIAIGFTHKSASLILYIVNAIFVVLAFSLKDITINLSLILLIVLAFVFSQVPFVIKNYQKNKKFIFFYQKKS